MKLIRIQEAKAIGGFRLRLILTNGQEIERDVSKLLRGSVFDALRNDPTQFGKVAVESGTIVWPNGADLCPDVLIWGGPPPKKDGKAPATLVLH